MKKDWYSPGSFLPADKEVNFKPDQIHWIIDHYSVLSEGRWPQKHSGYIDNPFVAPTKRSHSGAYFETPMAVLAEFHWRVQQCGRDGEAFLCCRCLKWDEPRVRELMGLKDWQLSERLSRVFRYVVGRRKERSYLEFIRH